MPEIRMESHVGYLMAPKKTHTGELDIRLKTDLPKRPEDNTSTIRSIDEQRSALENCNVLSDRFSLGK